YEIDGCETALEESTFSEKESNPDCSEDTKDLENIEALENEINDLGIEGIRCAAHTLQFTKNLQREQLTFGDLYGSWLQCQIDVGKSTKNKAKIKLKESWIQLQQIDENSPNINVVNVQTDPSSPDSEDDLEILLKHRESCVHAIGKQSFKKESEEIHSTLELFLEAP
ncbi:hypothetical protein CBL_21427, partial [Carabus blaptoides fortunei]